MDRLQIISITIPKGKPGSDDFTKGKHLTEILKSAPNGSIIDFVDGDFNKNNVLEAGEFFSVVNGDKETFYYSVKKGDKPADLYEKFNITSEDLSYLEKKGKYPRLNSNSFVHWTRTVSKPQIQKLEPKLLKYPSYLKTICIFKNFCQLLM